MSEPEQKKYEPELGQSLFGCQYQGSYCPGFVTNGLLYLGDAVEAFMERNDPNFGSPTKNSGSKFSNSTFSMRAYYWGDDEKNELIPNFQCGDFSITWYNYINGGTAMNRAITWEEFSKIIQKCLSSLF